MFGGCLLALFLTFSMASICFCYTWIPNRTSIIEVTVNELFAWVNVCGFKNWNDLLIIKNIELALFIFALICLSNSKFEYMMTPISIS